MWIYSQSSGSLWDDRGFCVASGYSGFEEGKNNPKFEDIPFKGPIPKGLWTIGKSYDSNNVGPFALPLLESGHDALGRNFFVIHGDSRTNPGKASKGCVIFPRHIREMIAKSKDRILKVIA